MRVVLLPSWTRTQRLRVNVPARTAQAAVAAGAALGGVVGIAAGVWAIYRPAGMITTGILLLVAAVGWLRGSE